MTSPIVPLTYYCALILAASVAGGMIPVWIRLTHRRTEIAVSFVAAMMLGIALLHLLPHALQEARNTLPVGASSDAVACAWVLAGWLAMFLIERFFCFHHHDVGSDAAGELHQQEGCDHQHHRLTWGGAALGLSLHSVLAGVALAASVVHQHGANPLAGFGTFLVILLHKPFDSMTISMLMDRGGWSMAARHLVNGLFALAIPIGAAVFYAGMATATPHDPIVAYALAFSAGMFLCISLSDLLPELQFHDHDRVTLTVALLVGLALAFAVCQLESLVHRH